LKSRENNFGIRLSKKRREWKMSKLQEEELFRDSEPIASRR